MLKGRKKQNWLCKERLSAELMRNGVAISIKRGPFAEREREFVSLLVSWCFKPSQPQKGIKAVGDFHKEMYS